MLERISGFTAEEAKNYLIHQLADDVTHESAMKVKEIEAQFKEEADTKAREHHRSGHPALRRRPCGGGHRHPWCPCPTTR